MLLATNQVVGPLMRELLADFERAGIPCRVVAGYVETDAEPVPFEVLRACPLVKAPLWKRLGTWSLFTLESAWHLVRHRRMPSLVVTNPPFVMLLMPLLKRLFGLRYAVLVYDVYPDVGEQMGYLKPGGWVSRIWRRLSRLAMLRAEGVITLGSHMAETLRSHLRPGEVVDIEVIPNWADTEAVRPFPKSENPFAREHDLEDKFVVLYAGNFGATHDIESIIEAADRLQNLPDLKFILVGGGTRAREVAHRVQHKALPNLTLLPLQPRNVYLNILAASDVALVSLGEAYGGASIPSKTYHFMAAGLPVLVICGQGTELAELVAEYRCGAHILPHRPEDLAAAVRGFYNDREQWGRARAAARCAAEERFSRKQATGRYLAHLAARFGWDRPEGNT